MGGRKRGHKGVSNVFGVREDTKNVAFSAGKTVCFSIPRHLLHKKAKAHTRHTSAVKLCTHKNNKKRNTFFLRKAFQTNDTTLYAVVYLGSDTYLENATKL